MSETPTSRGYGWAVQTDYATAKAIAAGNFKELIATDQNFIDYSPATQDNEAWSHPGINSPTDEWIENHDAKVSHTVPGFSQELGKIFYLNGSYAVATHAAGTLSKDHTFKPTDPAVTRQDKAVTYLEKVGTGWNVKMPSAVLDGWSLKGDALGVLMCDINLMGSGKLDFASTASFYPTATPTVSRLTGLHKLFNSQVALVVTDAGTPTTYGCRYRKFQVDYKKTMLDAAGMSPGCANFLTAGDPTSGAFRGSHEFDKQSLDFTLQVDMAAGSPEAVAVQQQKPLSVVITVTGGIIEGSIPHKLTLTIPVAKYKTSKPVVGDGIMQFTIAGKGLFDFTTNELFDIVLTNDVATYASAF